MVAFFASLTSDFSIPNSNAADQKLPFNNVLFNDGGFYSASDKKWTPPAGRVVLMLFVAINTVSTTLSTAATIYKNGVRLAFQFDPNISSSSTGVQMNLSSIIDTCTGTDVYEAYASYKDSNASTGSTMSADSTRNYFCGHVIH